jgi:hypothetical protein
MHVHAMRASQFAAEEDDPDRGERRGLLSSSTSEESEERRRSSESEWLFNAYVPPISIRPSPARVNGELAMERSSALIRTDQSGRVQWPTVSMNWWAGLAARIILPALSEWSCPVAYCIYELVGWSSCTNYTTNAKGVFGFPVKI